MKARQQIDAVLKYLYSKKDEARAIQYDIIKDNEALIKITGNVSELERMILKLKEDKYLQMYPDYPLLAGGKKDMSKGLFTYCSITFEGRLFWENGGYTKDLKRKKVAEFPKTYWYVIAVFAFTVGLFTDVIKTAISQRLLPNNTKSKHTIPINADSAQNHKKAH
jgi:hypothetical protein